MASDSRNRGGGGGGGSDRGRPVNYVADDFDWTSPPVEKQQQYHYHNNNRFRDRGKNFHNNNDNNSPQYRRDFSSPSSHNFNTNRHFQNGFIINNSCNCCGGGSSHHNKNNQQQHYHHHHHRGHHRSSYPNHTNHRIEDGFDWCSSPAKANDDEHSISSSSSSSSSILAGNQNNWDQQPPQHHNRKHHHFNYNNNNTNNNYNRHSHRNFGQSYRNDNHRNNYNYNYSNKYNNYQYNNDLSSIRNEKYRNLDDFDWTAPPPTSKHREEKREEIEEPPNSINILPHDVLAIIFRQFTIFQQLRMRAVCSNWNIALTNYVFRGKRSLKLFGTYEDLRSYATQVVMDQHLEKNSDFIFYPKTGGTSDEMVSSNANVMELVIQLFPNIRRLTIFNGSFNWQDMLPLALPKFQKLEQLTLCSLLPPPSMYDMPSTSKHPTIGKRLIPFRCEELTPSFWCAINQVSTLKQLHLFDLGNALMPYMWGLNNLESFSLAHYDRHNDCIFVLRSIINKNLRFLRLAGVGISLQQFQKLRTICGEDLARIEELSLGMIFFLVPNNNNNDQQQQQQEDRNVGINFRRPQGNHHNRTPVRANSLQLLELVCDTFTGLKKLTFDHLDSVRIVDMAQQLKKLPNLEYFHVHLEGVDERHFENVLHSPPVKSVKHLSIKDCCRINQDDLFSVYGRVFPCAQYLYLSNIKFFRLFRQQCDDRAASMMQACANDDDDNDDDDDGKSKDKDFLVEKKKQKELEMKKKMQQRAAVEIVQSCGGFSQLQHLELLDPIMNDPDEYDNIMERLRKFSVHHAEFVFEQLVADLPPFGYFPESPGYEDMFLEDIFVMRGPGRRGGGGGGNNNRNNNNEDRMLHGVDGPIPIIRMAAEDVIREIHRDVDPRRERRRQRRLQQQQQRANNNNNNDEAVAPVRVGPPPRPNLLQNE